MIEDIVRIAREAGHLILKFNTHSLNPQLKKDHSPVTQADLTSHRHITSSLTEISAYPNLSEEDPVDYAQRRRWQRFWLVDPLDGTKDFLRGTGHFTVNIALIENHRPILGVIYVPTLNKTYWAQATHGAFCEGERIHYKAAPDGRLRGADSHFHSGWRTQKFFEINRVAQIVPMGSSLKFCALAEGQIDVYPRLAPTSEWDTAAGEVILAEAGGEILDLEGRKLVYNKENILNPHFIASAKGREWKVPEASGQK